MSECMAWRCVMHGCERPERCNERKCEAPECGHCAHGPCYVSGLLGASVPGVPSSLCHDCGEPAESCYCDADDDEMDADDTDTVCLFCGVLFGVPHLPVCERNKRDWLVATEDEDDYRAAQWEAWANVGRVIRDGGA